MDLTVISGVPGVGTSELCERARRSLGEGYELVNFGDVMLEEAAAQGLIDRRDEIPTLPLRDLELLQRRAGEYVAERTRGRQVLLNTQLVVATVHGYVPGLPEPTLADVDPDRFVLVEADPEVVASRREDSEYRSYRETGVRSIAFHQELLRSAAMAHATGRQVPIRLIENTADAEDAAADLTAIVSEADPRS